MDKKYPTLDEVLAEGEASGVLRDTPRPHVPTTEERAAQGFEAINRFIDANARLPRADAEGTEHQLAVRLQSIRHDPESYGIRSEWDRHGLLSDTGDEDLAPSADPTAAATETPSDLDAILASDDMGLLAGDDSGLFTARHVSFTDSDRSAPDYIAQQKPCADFWRFDSLIQECAAAIESGRLMTARFKYGAQIDVGDYFILRGMLCYVADRGEDQWTDGEHNPRLRVIFANRTESDLLKLSLSRALYKDSNGRRVLQDPDRVFDRAEGITAADTRTGTIYVLRSRARHRALQNYPELYKIGYTEGEVSERIQNAADEPAYLEGEVEVVATFECYNLNPQRFEHLIHAFLHERRLDLTLTSRDGQTYQPREWFAVPLESVTTTIGAIIEGTITHYHLDATTGRVRRQSD